MSRRQRSSTVTAVLLGAVVLLPLVSSLTSQELVTEDTVLASTHNVTGTLRITGSSSSSSSSSGGGGNATDPPTRSATPRLRVIDCRGLPTAYLVRSHASLHLEALRLVNCAGHAIVLEPYASLTAVDVQLSGHTSSSASSAAAGGGSGQRRLGAVILAQQGARVLLERVAIQHNILSAGTAAGEAAAAAAWVPQLAGNSLEGGCASGGLAWPACGAPSITASLLHLDRSSLSLKDSSLTSNAAPALITAAAGGPQQLQIADSTVNNNTAAWLLVADAWAIDSVGRELLLAPAPSSSTEKSAAAVSRLNVSALDQWATFARPSNHPLFNQPLHGCGHCSQGPAASAAAATATGNSDIAAAWQRLQRLTGAAAEGQRPLQLSIRSSNISSNLVGSGLLWLRLANATLDGVVLADNRGSASAAVQAAAAGCRYDEPPEVCDIQSVKRALIQAHGPSGMLLNNCTLRNNTYERGGLFRVTDAIGLVGLQDSTITQNKVTSLLRFEGRGWTKDPSLHFESTFYLDVLVFNRYHGKTNETYKKELGKFFTERDRQSAANYYSFLFLRGCRLEWNTVSQALLVSRGDRVSYRDYSNSQLAENLKLSHNTTMLWVDNTSLSHNIHDSSWAAQSDEAEVSEVVAMFLLNPPSLQQQLRGLTSRFTAAKNCSKETAAKHCSKKIAAAAKDHYASSSKPANTLPRSAVLWAAKTEMFLGRLSLKSNTGFSHVMLAESTTPTLMSVDISNNRANQAVVTMWFATIVTQGLRAVANEAPGGVIDLNAIRLYLEQAHIANNTMRPRTNSTLTTERSDLSAGGGRSTSNATGAATQGAGNASAACCAFASPVVTLKSLDSGSLHDLNITGNQGSYALYADIWFIDGREFSGDNITGLRIEHNQAKGLCFVNFDPRFEGAQVGLNNSIIAGNRFCTGCAVQDPLRAFGGGLLFASPKSEHFAKITTVLDNLIVRDNGPADVASCNRTFGGGLAFPVQEGYEEYENLKTAPITVRNSVFESNIASNGGALWSDWPVKLENCSFRNNTATVAGGGMLLRGMQQNDLTKLPATHVVACSISNNSAAWGGGIACSNCRAVLLDSRVFNNAARDWTRERWQAGRPQLPDICIDQRNSTQGSSGSGNGGDNSDASRGNSSRDDSSSRGNSGSNSNSVSARLLQSSVDGVGGGLAAALDEHTSFVALGCGSSITGNTASWAGGAVYLHASGTEEYPTGPADAQASGLLSGPDGLPPSHPGCSPSNIRPSCECVQRLKGQGILQGGLTVLSSDGAPVTWGVSSLTPSRGQLLAHTGNMRLCGPCSTSDSNTSSLVGSCGFSHACFAGAAAGNDVQLHFERVSDTNTGSISSCSEASNCSTSSSSALVYQLPLVLEVANTTCMQEASGGNSAACRLAASQQDVHGHIRTRIRSGDQIQMTVGLRRECHQGLFNTAAANTLLADINVQQTDPSLFIVGPTTAKLLASTNVSTKMASLALLMDQPPRQNVKKSFRIELADAHPLLRQVEAMTINLTVLKCTMGQYELNNQCIKCNNNGTFRLNPINSGGDPRNHQPANNSQATRGFGCQTCVGDGGNCSRGLMAPAADSFMPNPFLPQVVPCPYKNACRHQQAGSSSSGSGSSSSSSSSSGSSSSGSNRANAHHRRLLQALVRRAATAAAAVPPPASPVSTDAAPLQGLVWDARIDVSKACSTLQLPLHPASICLGLPDRTECLLHFQSWLADAITNSSAGVSQPLMAKQHYCRIVSTWQQLQCSRGYTGRFCGRCESAYMGDASASNRTIMFVYQWSLNRCLECAASRAKTVLAVVGLFVLACVYSILPVMLELHKRLPGERSGSILQSMAHALKTFKSRAQRQQSTGQKQQQRSQQPCPDDTSFIVRDQSRPLSCIVFHTSVSSMAAEAAVERAASAPLGPAAERPVAAATAADTAESWSSSSSGSLSGSCSSAAAAAEAAAAEAGQGRPTLSCLTSIKAGTAELHPANPVHRIQRGGFNAARATRPQAAAAAAAEAAGGQGEPAAGAAGEQQERESQQQPNTNSSIGSRALRRARQVLSLVDTEEAVAVWKMLTSFWQLVLMGSLAEVLDYESLPGMRWAPELLRFFTLDCLISSHLQPWERAIMVLVWQALGLPLALVCAAGCVLMMTRRLTNWSMFRQWKTSSMLGVAVLVILHLQYTVIIQAMLKAFNCTAFTPQAEDVPALNSWLLGGMAPNCSNFTAVDYSSTGLVQSEPMYFWQADHDLRCFRGPHLAFVIVFGVLGVLLLGLILPALGMFHFGRFYRRPPPDNDLSVWRFMYEEYREECSHWEFVIMARKVAFLVAINMLRLTPGNAARVKLLQLLTLAMLAVVSLLLQMRCEPFARVGLNYLEAYSLAVLVIVYGLMGCLVVMNQNLGVAVWDAAADGSSSGASRATQVALRVLAWGLVALMSLVFVLWVFKHARWVNALFAKLFGTRLFVRRARAFNARHSAGMLFQHSSSRASSGRLPPPEDSTACPACGSGSADLQDRATVVRQTAAPQVADRADMHRRAQPAARAG